MNIEDYIRGYSEGLKEAWKTVLRMIVKGHTPKEIEIAIKAMLSTIDREAEHKKRSLMANIAGTHEEAKAFSAATARPEACGVSAPHGLGIARGGGIFLMKDQDGRRTAELVSRAIARNVPVLVVGRENPHQFVKKCGQAKAGSGSIKYVWLTKAETYMPTPAALAVAATAATTAGGDETPGFATTISPTSLALLSTEISTFVKNREQAIVILDVLTYIITQNGFDSVLKFVQYIGDVVRKHNATLYIPYIKASLSEKELGLLLAEAEADL